MRIAKASTPPPLRVLIDTSYLVGLIEPMDVWHAQSRAIYGALQQKGTQAVYTDCVINEAINVLVRRSEERGRLERFPGLMDLLHHQVPSSAITWIYGQVRRWYEPIFARVRESQGRLNFHDALLILAAREMNIPAIVSFDGDFDGVPELVRLHQPEDILQ